ncbi:MAG: serine/threonine-protein kinase, partial [bacterium]
MMTSDRAAASDCPSTTELSLFAVGKMSSERVEAIARHVEQCDSCAGALATLDPDDDVLVSQLRMKSELEWATPREQLRIANLLTRRGSEVSAELGDASLLDSCPSRTLGDYRLLEKLGAGGMGAAYRAIHTRLGKMVVIKVLPPQRSKDPEAVLRFGREMKAIGSIDHPRIVKALDAGEQEGIHYLVMEHVDGITLSDLVERNGALPIGSACEIIRQVAMGLTAIHGKGIVHRDIKPSNIMLTHMGEVKLLDLGVAL